MAYEINFCETKEQLKHLAEVVTGRVDGKATGAVIEESSLEYLGQVRETLDALLEKIGWYSVGEWSTDPLVEFGNQFVTHNGIRYVPLSLPYQVNSATNPDPDALVGTQLKVITDVTDGDISNLQQQIDDNVSSISQNSLDIYENHAGIAVNSSYINDLTVDKNRTSTLNDRYPVINFRPETLVYSDAMGGAFSSDGGEFLSGLSSVSSVAGLVGLDEYGYYVSLDSSSDESITYQADLVKTNSDFTVSIKLSHEDLVNPSYEPFIFSNEPSGTYTDTERFGLVLGSTLQLWDSFSGAFRDLFDYDFRDGTPHEYTLSFNSKSCQLLLAVDGLVVFNRQFNASDLLLPLFSDWLTIAGYKGGTNRHVNGKLYGARVWNYFTTDVNKLISDNVIMSQSLKFSPKTLPSPEYAVKPGASESYRSMEFIDTHIILGQSNASGRGLVSDVMSATNTDQQYTQLEFLNWKLYNQFIANNNDDKHQVIELGANQAFGSDNTDSTTFGFETSMALSEFNQGNKCLYIRRSLSGTSLYSDWNPNGGSEGALYLQAISDIEDAFDEALAAGYIPVIKSITWMQGERDAKGDLGANPITYYQSYLETLIVNVRSTCASKVSTYSSYASYFNSRCRVIIPDIKIGPTQIPNYPEWENINAYHLAAAKNLSNAITIDTSFLPQNDDLHFNAYGLMSLGEKIVQTVHKKRKYV